MYINFNLIVYDVFSDRMAEGVEYSRIGAKSHQTNYLQSRSNFVCYFDR